MNSEQKVDSSINTPARLDKHFPATSVDLGREGAVGPESKTEPRFSEKQFSEEPDFAIKSFSESIYNGVIEHMVDQTEAVRNAGDRTAIFRSYHEGQEALRRMEAQFQSFFRSIFLASMSGSNPRKSNLILEDDRLLSRLTNDPQLAFALPKSLVDSTALALDFAKLRTLFGDHLEKSVELFSSSVFSRLAILFEMKIIGAFHWLKDQCVVLHYIQHRQEREETTIRIGNRRNGREEHHIEVQRILTQTTFEHLLTDAFETTVENREVDFPPAAQAIVTAFPSWMGSKLKVIHGDLVSERQIEVQQVITENIIRTVEVEDTYVHRDPAIVLGPFVLMGWVDRSSPVVEKRDEDSVDKVFEQVDFDRNYLLGGFLVFMGIVFVFFQQLLLGFGCFSVGILLIGFIYFIQNAGSERPKIDAS